MRRAIELAAHHHPHPNPRVGAVVLDRTATVVGEGAHAGVGTQHAERLALERAGERARGGTLVVTLEPCSHHGLTPPCTEAVIASGVSRVVIGTIDPDSRVSGSGVRRIRAGGIEVIEGTSTEEVEALDPAYFHHRRTGRPLVTLKTAMTLDGQTAARDGTSRWITGEEARLDAHQLRAEHDAIVVGAGTVRDDDPELSVRIDGYEGPQPRPVVFAGRKALPEDARLWSRSPLVLGPSDFPAPEGAELVVVDTWKGGPELARAMEILGQRGYLAVLVEGGARLAAALWAADLIDRGVVYLGAGLAGGQGRGMIEGAFETMSDLTAVTITGTRMVGTDVRIDWRR